MPRQYSPRRPSIDRPCEVCGATMTVRASRVERGNGRFCSIGCANRSRRTTLAERFWPKVDRTDDPDACWLWAAGRYPRSGYGSFAISPTQHREAHRIAWELATGETLTHDDVIGHVCDVRDCVRNDDIGSYEVNGVRLPRVGHLFKGTQADNIADRDAKGRQATGCRHGSQTKPERVLKGAGNGMSKLTIDQVRAIRAAYAAGGRSQQSIADEFGIHQSVVSDIVRREIWQHVD
jgi:Autographiviridae endonuclease